MAGRDTKTRFQGVFARHQDNVRRCLDQGQLDPPVDLTRLTRVQFSAGSDSCRQLPSVLVEPLVRMPTSGSEPSQFKLESFGVCDMAGCVIAVQDRVAAKLLALIPCAPPERVINTTGAKAHGRDLPGCCGGADRCPGLPP
jgi:hypothetical protein